MLAKSNRSDIQVTLISDGPMSPYSGMIPSFLAGIYKASDLQFDLQKICDRFHFNFIESRVILICAEKNLVQLSTQKFLEYDICSVNIGIESNQIPTDVQDEKNIVYLKPISKLIESWNLLKNSAETENCDIKIIGGGAAAFEIAIACRRHFKKNEITLISGKTGLLPEHSALAKKLAQKSLAAAKINLLEGQRVEKITDQYLSLSDGTRLTKDICFVGTTAAVNPLFKRSGLKVNEFGFVHVDKNLLVEGTNNLFAAGDCCHFAAEPLAKAGVYAVRQGPVVYKNIIAFLENKPLIKYKPQTEFLKILVSGDQEAIAIYGKFVFKGLWAWKLKNYIDLKFMKKFK